MLKFKENKCRILSFTYIPHYISHTLYCCLIYVYTRTHDETTNGKNIYAYLSNVWRYTSKRISIVSSEHEKGEVNEERKEERKRFEVFLIFISFHGLFFLWTPNVCRLVKRSSWLNERAETKNEIWRLYVFFLLPTPPVLFHLQKACLKQTAQLLIVSVWIYNNSGSGRKHLDSVWWKSTVDSYDLYKAFSCRVDGLG